MHFALHVQHSPIVILVDHHARPEDIHLVKSTIINMMITTLLDQKRYKHDVTTKKLGLRLLKDIVARMARASLYAAGCQAQFLLQSCVLLSMNAFFVVTPSPKDCITEGVVGNVEDLDPDTYVGVANITEKATKELMERLGVGSKLGNAEEEGEEQEPPDEEAIAAAEQEALQNFEKNFVSRAPEKLAEEYASRIVATSSTITPPRAEAENGLPCTLWLNLGIISRNVIDTLQAMKEAAEREQSFAAAAKDKANQKLLPEPLLEDIPKRPNETMACELVSDVEKIVFQEARVAKQRLKSLGEETDLLWFEETDLDLTSIAKFVGFTVLCFYHMRRWRQVLRLSWDFDAATSGIFSSKFLPFMVAAQKNMLRLSKTNLTNSTNYLTRAKTVFDIDQKKVPRKLLRQLVLLGQLSEPEKLYNRRMHYYTAVKARQEKLHAAWKHLREFVDTSQTLVAKEVPAAREELRKNRAELASFMHQKFRYLHSPEVLDEAQVAIVGRHLKNFAKNLKESYRNSVEMLKRREMTLMVVQSLHELGRKGVGLEGGFAVCD